MGSYLNIEHSAAESSVEKLSCWGEGSERGARSEAQKGVTCDKSEKLMVDS